MKSLSRALKALSDQNRLKILKMLEVRPLCVCEITEMLHVSTSTVSKHLAILRDAGFIADQKDGKYVEYSIDIGTDRKEIRQLLALAATWGTDDPEVRTYPARLKNIDRVTLCGG